MDNFRMSPGGLDVWPVVPVFAFSICGPAKARKISD